jgi:hypothetical protein
MDVKEAELQGKTATPVSTFFANVLEDGEDGLKVVIDGASPSTLPVEQ